MRPGGGEVRECGLLFTGWKAEKVAALPVGGEIETRRLVRMEARAAEALKDAGRPEMVAPGFARWFHLGQGWNAWSDRQLGAVGQRVWMRECWAADESLDQRPPSTLDARCVIWYRAGAAVRLGRRTQVADSDRGRWRPGIHMPRWASRATLQMVDARVERLQDITEAGAEAEGVEPRAGLPMRRGVFADAWIALHGRGSFAANPWVWVLRLRRLP